MTDLGDKYGTPPGMFQFWQGSKIKLQRSKIKLRTLQLKPNPLCVQTLSIGYLFCYNIKWFPTLRQAWGVIRLRGVHVPLSSYAFCMFACLPYFDISICLDAPVHLDVLLYVWMPPVHLNVPAVCLDTPICMDAPCMFGCHPYVWMPLLYLDAPCMFG